MIHHWSTLQLTEFFSALSGGEQEGAVRQLAAERAAEALEAEIAAVVIDGTVRAVWGVRPGTADSEILSRVGPARTIELPALGTVHTFAARLGRGTGDFLVVGRLDHPLDGAERQTVQAMAQLLSLVLRNVREAAERRRLLEELRTRQRLLEQLLTIQQAVSARRPLPEVLDAVTAGAAELLDHCPVVLVLAGASAEHELSVVSGDRARVNAAVLEVAHETIASGAPVSRDRLIAAPVSIGPRIAGSLVVVHDSAEGDRPAEHQDLLVAFAQQASLALTDAHTVEAVTQAHHDPVTGLPNRTLFLDRLRDALAEHRDDIVLFIDLDRFKAVNDSLGHRAGDELLAAVSQRITACLGSGDTAARIGGDEFAVLLRDSSLARALTVAESVIAALRRPFHVSTRDVLIGASVGVADRSGHAGSADDLLSNADVAMYSAKKNGASQVAVFEPRMLTETVTRMELLADLQRALHLGDLRLHYQPLVNLSNLRPVGLEALMRWTCPRRGAVSPADFIPLAEESNLIVELGRWALQEGTHQLARWLPEFPGLGLNVNIAAPQLSDRDFVPYVTEVLRTQGVPPTAMTFELTESAMMRDPDTAVHQMRQLKDLGIALSVDDFGTGYSSLSYLRRFPVDELKIDRSFVGSMNHSTEDLAVVRTVVELGRSLRLQTVAEGIEDAEQLSMLHRLGCDLGQGYHLARPLPDLAATAWLREHTDAQLPKVSVYSGH